MKKKWMASTALACSCMLLISGCSGNKADDFDAVAYTTAYLDGMIRGNHSGFLVGATPSRLLTSSNSGFAMIIPMALEVSMEEPPPIAIR